MWDVGSSDKHADDKIDGVYEAEREFGGSDYEECWNEPG